MIFSRETGGSGALSVFTAWNMVKAYLYVAEYPSIAEMIFLIVLHFLMKLNIQVVSHKRKLTS